MMRTNEDGISDSGEETCTNCHRATLFVFVAEIGADDAEHK